MDDAFFNFIGVLFLKKTYLHWAYVTLIINDGIK